MASNTSGYTSLGKPESTDWEEHSAVGDVSGGRRFKATQLVPNALVVDAVSSVLTYIGETKPGTATSGALWRIKKIAVSGTVTTISFADGDDLFDNVWDNRGSLTYA